MPKAGRKNLLGGSYVTGFGAIDLRDDNATPKPTTIRASTPPSPSPAPKLPGHYMFLSFDIQDSRVPTALNTPAGPFQDPFTTLQRQAGSEGQSDLSSSGELEASGGPKGKSGVDHPAANGLCHQAKYPPYPADNNLVEAFQEHHSVPHSTPDQVSSNTESLKEWVIIAPEDTDMSSSHCENRASESAADVGVPYEDWQIIPPLQASSMPYRQTTSQLAASMQPRVPNATEVQQDLSRASQLARRVPYLNEANPPSPTPSIAMSIMSIGSVDPRDYRQMKRALSVRSEKSDPEIPSSDGSMETDPSEEANGDTRTPLKMAKESERLKGHNSEEDEYTKEEEMIRRAEKERVEKERAEKQRSNKKLKKAGLSPFTPLASAQDARSSETSSSGKMDVDRE